MDEQAKIKLINECLALVEYRPLQAELKFANDSPVNSKPVLVSFSHKKTPRVT